MVGIKPTEEVRGDLGLQFPHMESRVFGIKRLSVDKFERPGPYIEEDILTLQEGPAFSDTTESDMGKRTPHIGVHLNDSHALSICRQIIWAFLSLPDVGVTKLRGARRTNVEVDASSWVKVLSAMKGASMGRSGLCKQVVLGATFSVLVLASSLVELPASADGSRSAHSQELKKATLACYSVLGLNEVNAPSYVGLTVGRARAKVRASTSVSTSRIVAEDGRCLRNTLDLRPSRVNFWVFQGHVIEARRF